MGFTTSAPLTAVPWNKAQLTHGRIALEGGLDASLSLGRLRGSPEFAFPFRLEHALSAYPLGEHAVAVEATSCRFPNASGMLESFLLSCAPVSKCKSADSKVGNGRPGRFGVHARAREATWKSLLQRTATGGLSGASRKIGTVEDLDRL